MSKSVKLRDIIDGMEFQSDEMSSYLNKETGEVVSVTEDELCAADDPSEEDSFDLDEKQLEIASDILDEVSGKKYIPLPSMNTILWRSFVCRLLTRRFLTLYIKQLKARVHLNDSEIILKD